MEPGGDASGWLDDLKRQFNGMDVADDAGAVTAMRGAAALLRKRELSFRLLVQRIETQRWRCGFCDHEVASDQGWWGTTDDRRLGSRWTEPAGISFAAFIGRQAGPGG